MAEIDLSKLPDSEIVLHFGGRSNEIDAFTFSNSLVAFAEALQEINRQISPELAVEVAIEGVGPGCFRAKINTKIKSLGGLWRGVGKPLLIGILASYIYERTLGTSTVIKVDSSMVVIEQGSNRIIIPRDVYDARQKLPRPQQIERHVARAFAAMEDDPSVTDFALMARIDDPTPPFAIPREDFPRLSTPELSAGEDGRRYRDERTLVTIVKAVFERGNRKWEFVWQSGVRISAPIQDPTFFDKLASREFWFAQGDTLDVMLRVHQKFDDINGVYINEWYEIIKVFRVDHREHQGRLPSQ